ncbi:hypothetical protein B0T09DRAFT_403396 [Sordaria sp. MPI-SDFR-AT-0083]|nr:hypothetical protein B0T09DRAFT_403396 [Sordaria sp. MPI-SDFR-AT-0083]
MRELSRKDIDGHHHTQSHSLVICCGNVTAPRPTTSTAILTPASLPGSSLHQRAASSSNKINGRHHHGLASMTNSAPTMSDTDFRDEIAELLAPSVEARTAKGLNEDFPDDPNWTTHLPLDPNTLEAICRVNLPNFLIDRHSVAKRFKNHGFEQSDLGMSFTLRQYYQGNEGCAGERTRLGFDGSILIWVRYTTVFELQPQEQGDTDCKFAWRDIGRIVAALDKAMTEHKRSASEVPKSSIFRAILPERFIVDKFQLVKFFFSEGAHSHREVKLESYNASPMVDFNGVQRPHGVIDTEFRVMFDSKGMAKLVVRTAHKSSLWPSEHVYELEA